MTSKKKKKPKAGQSSPKLRCTVRYDTKGRGWKNIKGCYYKSSSSTPNFWVVYRSPKKHAAYIALDSKSRGKIDTIMIKGKKKKGILHYFDTDCDGIIDLIGVQYDGKKEIESYRKPSKRISTVSLAKELDSALKNKKIPYPSLRICQ